MTTPTPLVTITAAGRHRGTGGGFRFRHGWIPLDGSKDVKETGDEIANDRPSMGRGSEAIRVARSEARARLDAALSRLEKVSPEGARRQRAQLNELRESGKLTPDRMRTATQAAERAAVPYGHEKAGSPHGGLGADKFGPGAKNRDGGNGGHGGTGPDTEARGGLVDVTSRGGDGVTKGRGNGENSLVDRLRDRKGAFRDELVKSLSDADLRAAHDATRAQHKTASPGARGDLAEVAQALKAEHGRRKQAGGGDAVPAKKSAAGVGGPAKATGDSIRGDSKAAKDARVTLDNLRGTTGDNTTGVLEKLTDPQLRNLHEAIRAQHADTSSPGEKATMKRLSDAVRAEHTRRKQGKKPVTASGAPLVTIGGALTAASDSSVSRQQKDQAAAKKAAPAAAKKAPAKSSGKASGKSSSKSGGSSGGGKSGGGGGGGSFSEDKHPRQPAGSGDKSGEFAPAGGGGKDDAGKKAQQNKTAQGNFLKLAGMNPADSKKFLAGLSEKDLTELTEIAYSAKTSDPKVVTQRTQISAEMTKRGISIQDHGARGGGLPKGAKPGAAKAPAKKAVKASAGPLVHLHTPAPLPVVTIRETA